MVKCSSCHHPGAHAVIIPREGWPTRCGDCPRCEADDTRGKREQGE
ncbi:hypothetical protein RKD49_007853 [Streptomyces glaucescens]